MSATKLHVGNLPDHCLGESLRDLFSPYGEVKDLTVIKNYAFVHFARDDDANRAVQDLHKTKMLGKEITVAVSTNVKSKSRTSGGSRGRGDRNSDRRRQEVPPIGGILGAAPVGLPAGLGLLSAVNAVQTLNNVVAAAAGRQAEMAEQNERNDRAPPSRTNLSDGFVIYERYYVDPTHPLLKGLSLPELPRAADNLRITDSSVAQDIYQKRDSYPDRSENYNKDYRDRSPLQTPRGYDIENRQYGSYDNYDRV